jgi:tRNA (guanine-N7-)-methyltransferase
MRMRKKNYQDEVLASSAYLINQPARFLGVWKDKLNTLELHVEIGSGKGDYWRMMALKYPQAGWVGIERNVNIASIALKKAQEVTMPNAGFVVDDADCIEQWFMAGEIDVLHLNFSDPWPKRAHIKRRLTHQSFVRKYYQLLSEQGMLILKSDNRELFEFSLVEVSKQWFVLDEVSVDFRSTVHDEDVITEYERRFMDLGQPIYRAVWRKR